MERRSSRKPRHAQPLSNNNNDDDDDKYHKRQQPPPHPLEWVLRVFVGMVLLGVCGWAATDLGWMDDLQSAFTLALSSTMSSPTKPPQRHATERRTATVTVIGAGAAGLSVAYHLRHISAVDRVVVLEASDRLGGRVRHDTSFLGSRQSLDVGASMVGNVDMVERVMGQRAFDKVEFGQVPIYEEPYFLHTNFTYYDVLADYMAPMPESNHEIVYHCVVDRVEYDRGNNNHDNDNQVHVWCGNRLFVSQFVVVTVPLSVLKDGDITFVPPLPAQVTWNHPGDLWKGVKVVLEFSYNFFEGGGSCFDTDCAKQSDGEFFVWDAGLEPPNQTPRHHLMVGHIVGQYLDEFPTNTDHDLVQHLLDRLDEPFDGQATRHSLDHLVFNWTAQPYIRGTYPSQGLAGGPQPITQQLFVAGDAFPVTQEETGWVHGAFHSGKEAARQIAALLSDEL